MLNSRQPLGWPRGSRRFAGKSLRNFSGTCGEHQQVVLVLCVGTWLRPSLNHMHFSPDHAPGCIVEYLRSVPPNSRFIEKKNMTTARDSNWCHSTSFPQEMLRFAGSAEANGSAAPLRWSWPGGPVLLAGNQGGPWGYLKISQEIQFGYLSPRMFVVQRFTPFAWKSMTWMRIFLLVEKAVMVALKCGSKWFQDLFDYGFVGCMCLVGVSFCWLGHLMSSRRKEGRTEEKHWKHTGRKGR